MTTFYKQHIFLCTNQKPLGKTCCANSGGETFFTYLKGELTTLGMAGPGKIRVSKSGCLGRCDLGPCMVIYPEGIWYTYASFADIDEIIRHTLQKGNIVSRLLIDAKLSTS